MPNPHEHVDRARRRVRSKIGTAPLPNGRAKPARAQVPPDRCKGLTQPQMVEPYRPFPVVALPDPIGEYVRQAAAALGCDPAYVALPAMAVAASAVGNTRTIRLKRGWTEPAVVWSAIIGESGTLKSPAFHATVGYLFRVQHAHLATYKAKLAEYRERQRKAKVDQSDPGDAPTLQRIICSDVTIERLAEILEDSPRGLLAARDELSAWLGSFARYKGKQGGSDLPHWLEVFRAGNITYDRKTGERRTIFVPNAAVSVTGSIQPVVLALALAPEIFDAGLAARLLLAMPLSRPKRWSEIEIAPEVEAAYHDVLDRLLALDFGHNGKGQKVAHVLHLSSEAKLAWVEFYNEWAQEQAQVEGELAAAFSKLEAYAARFALLHHVVSRVGRGQDDVMPIQAESVKAGVVLCRWFAAEARRIYATFSETSEQRAARKLEEHIRARGGRITARELQRSNSRKYSDAQAAEAALQALVESGRATWEPRSASSRGGQPARYLRLHPTHDTTDSTGGARVEDDDGQADGTADSTSSGAGFLRGNRASVGTVMRRPQEQGTGNVVGSDGTASASNVGYPEATSDEDPASPFRPGNGSGSEPVECGDGHGDAWEGM